jgi:hypothetical protein
MLLDLMKLKMYVIHRLKVMDKQTNQNIAKWNCDAGNANH